MTTLAFRHVTPAFRTFCGPDALAALPKDVDRIGARRVVIFCGPSLRRHPDAVARVEEALGPRLAGCFDGVQEHSPLAVVEAGRRALQDAGADAVVAVGGGSAVVTARAASILLAEGQDVHALCTRRGPDGRLVSPRLNAPKLPHWVVPSTPTTAYAKAGSAVRDPDSGERLPLFDPKTRAQGIFLHPAVAMTAPPALVRSAALDAVTMAVEGLQAGGGDPLAAAQLNQALRMLGQWLPRVLDSGQDAEPRLHLMVAALLAGQGNDVSGGGLAQPIAHAAGPRSAVANGVVEALLLPGTMRFTAPVAGAALTAVAEALGAPATPSVTPADLAITAVEGLLAEVGVPTRLREIGLAREDLDAIAEHALEDWSMTRVPRPAGPDELRELLHSAW